MVSLGIVGCGPLPAPDAGLPVFDAALPAFDAAAPSFDVAPLPVPAAVIAQRVQMVITTLPPAVTVAATVIQLWPTIPADQKARDVAQLTRVSGVLVPDLEHGLAAYCGPRGIAHCAADPAHQCLINDAATGISTALADVFTDLGTNEGWSMGPVVGMALSACGAIVDAMLPACHPSQLAAGALTRFGADLADRIHALPAGLRPMPTVAEAQAMAGDAGVSVAVRPRAAARHGAHRAGCDPRHGVTDHCP